MCIHFFLHEDIIGILNIVLKPTTLKTERGSKKTYIKLQDQNDLSVNFLILY